MSVNANTVARFSIVTGPVSESTAVTSATLMIVSGRHIMTRGEI
jgi:hypothetical protein